MDIRVKFIKGEEVKYISHLDLMRTFQRMLKRTGLSIKYSEGFNPHMNLTFALPLPVGVTSDGEYAQFSVNEEKSLEEIKNILNENAPAGIRIVEASNELTPAFKEIKRAEYEITIKTKTPLSSFENILSEDEILIDKKTKKGVREINIKPLISSYSLEEKDGAAVINLVCAAGSESNLNPDLLIKAFDRYLENADVSYYSIHRRRLIFPTVYEF